MEPLDNLVKNVEHVGRLNVIKPVLEWALKHHAVIPQFATDELVALTDELRRATAS